MKYWLLSGFTMLVLGLVGCGDGPSVTGSTAPLTEEEKRKIAEEDRRIDEDESPGNKTRNMKPKGKGR
jgi:hypothetical protein